MKRFILVLGLMVASVRAAQAAKSKPIVTFYTARSGIGLARVSTR